MIPKKVKSSTERRKFIRERLKEEKLHKLKKKKDLKKLYDDFDRATKNGDV